MPPLHTTIKLMVNFIGGHALHTKIKSRYEILCRNKCPFLMPLHIHLSTEQHLTDRLLLDLLHVTPTTSAKAYQKNKALD
jgi:hypothetical protein